MIKKLLRPLYVPLYNYFNKWRYFFLPNIFTKTNYEKGNRLQFNQKTFLTGKGTIKIYDNVHLGFKPGGFHYGGSIELQARTENSYIEIGENVSTNNNIFICSSGKITIGKYTLIGQGVVIMDFEAHGIRPEDRRKVGESGTVEIAENVWIGNNVTILKNTKIGKNSIVAAGAVVNGIFPDNVIIGGVPAKIIKNL